MAENFEACKNLKLLWNTTENCKKNISLIKYAYKSKFYDIGYKSDTFVFSENFIDAHYIGKYFKVLMTTLKVLKYVSYL